MVILKNCESELSYVLADPFHNCLKDYYFQTANVSCAPCVKECWGRPFAKNCYPVNRPIKFLFGFSILFLKFSLIGGVALFCMTGFHMVVPVILGLLKVPFVSPHFFCYALIIYRIMLCVTLLSM